MKKMRSSPRRTDLIFAAAPSQEQLEMYGIKEMDAVLSNFYPLQKQQILKSWQRLTRYHEELVHGNTELVRDVQAGLWRIKKEWIR